MSEAVLRLSLTPTEIVDVTMPAATSIRYVIPRCLEVAGQDPLTPCVLWELVDGYRWAPISDDDCVVDYDGAVVVLQAVGWGSG